MKEHLIVPIEETFDELRKRRLKDVGFIPDPTRFNRVLEVDEENPYGSEERSEPIFDRPQIFPYTIGEGYKAK